MSESWRVKLLEKRLNGRRLIHYDDEKSWNFYAVRYIVVVVGDQVWSKPTYVNESSVLHSSAFRIY